MLQIPFCVLFIGVFMERSDPLKFDMSLIRDPLQYSGILPPYEEPSGPMENLWSFNIEYLPFRDLFNMYLCYIYVYFFLCDTASQCIFRLQ